MTKQQMIAVLAPFCAGPTYFDIPDDGVVMMDKPNNFAITAGDVRAAQDLLLELKEQS